MPFRINPNPLVTVVRSCVKVQSLEVVGTYRLRFEDTYDNVDRKYDLKVYGVKIEYKTNM